MAGLVTQAVGAGLVVIGCGLIAPFAAFLAAGVLLITLGIALERDGK